MRHHQKARFPVLRHFQSLPRPLKGLHPLPARAARPVRRATAPSLPRLDNGMGTSEFVGGCPDVHGGIVQHKIFKIDQATCQP